MSFTRAEQAARQSLNEKKISQIIKASELIENELSFDIELKNAVRQRTVLSKMWILLSSDKLHKEYLELWNNEKLYKTNGISFKRKIILWLSGCHFYWIVKIILWIAKSKE